jgi:hypothetical protein
MIIDAHATDTTPSYEVRRRALEALASTGEPMSEVTYDALQKRLAALEAENAKLKEASDLTSLRRQWSFIIDGEGGNCPCCDRWGKIYAHRISGSMAATLCWLCDRSPNEEWVNMPEDAPRWGLRGYQFPTLEKWGLLERNYLTKKEMDENDIKNSGFWRPTERGRAFAKGLITVPKIAFLYNNTLVRYSDEQVSIEDCLGKKFSYLATMRIETSVNSDEEESNWSS